LEFVRNKKTLDEVTPEGIEKKMSTMLSKYLIMKN